MCVLCVCVCVCVKGVADSRATTRRAVRRGSAAAREVPPAGPTWHFLRRGKEGGSEE